MMTAGIDADRHRREATAVSTAPYPLQKLIHLDPKIGVVRIAFDDLVRDRPAFLIHAPADDFELDAIVLNVAADRDDRNAVRHFGVPNLAPGRQYRFAQRT